VLEQMLVGVGTRNYARSLEPVQEGLESVGTSRSEVSRQFVAVLVLGVGATLSQTLRSTLPSRRWWVQSRWTGARRLRRTSTRAAVGVQRRSGHQQKIRLVALRQGKLIDLEVVPVPNP
jgi:hypothetical protein